MTRITPTAEMAGAVLTDPESTPAERLKVVIDYWIPKLGSGAEYLYVADDLFVWFEGLDPKSAKTVRGYIRDVAGDYGMFYEPEIRPISERG